MPSILLVEDNPHDAEFLRHALQSPTWQLYFAASCQEADRLRAEHPPDLIITDIHLPDQNGLRWIASLRRQGYQNPIIVITGVENSTENVIAAIRAGADDYLLKAPQSYAHLADIVARNLHQRQALTARRRPLQVLYAIADPLAAAHCRQQLHAQAPHIQLTCVHTLGALQRALQDQHRFDAIVLEGDLPEANLLTIVQQYLPQAPQMAWLVADPHPSPELARLLLTAGLAAYLPRTPDTYCTMLPIMIENAVTRLRLQQEETRRQFSEARYSRLVEHLPDVVYRYDLLPQPRLTYISAAIEQLTGYSPEEMLQSEDVFWQAVHPQDRATLRQALHTAAPEVSIRWLPRSGGTVWTELRNTAIYNENQALSAVEGIVRNVSEQRLTYRNLQARIQELELSIEMGRIVIQSQDRDALCHGLIVAVTSATNYEHFGIFFVDPHAQTYSAHPASYGLPADIVQKDFPLRHGLVGHCLHTRQALKIDAAAQPAHTPLTPEMRSAVCVPIHAGEQLWGAVLIEDRQPAALGENDLRLATLVAEYLALGLEKIALLQQERQRRTEAESLRHAISYLSQAPLALKEALEHILTGLQKVIPYTSASLALLEGETMVFHAVKNLPPTSQNLCVSLTASPLMRELIAEPQPVILNDASEIANFRQFEENLPPIRSWMCLPLVNTGRVLGFLFCDHTEANIFTPEHLRLSLPFAQQAVLAIEKARLHEQTRQAARRMEILHRASQDILRLQNDPHKLYPAIHQIVTRLMPCDAFAIALQTDEKPLQIVYLAEGDNTLPTAALSQKALDACQVFIRKQAQIIPDLQTRFQGASPCDALSSPVRSLIAVPIQRGQKIAGALSVQSFQPDTYTTQDLHLLEILASHVAIALENRHLLLDLQTRLQEAAIIRRAHETLIAYQQPEALHAHILQILVEDLPSAEKGSILLLEEDGSLRVDTAFGYKDDIRGMVFPPGKGYAQRCIQTQRGLIVQNTQNSDSFYRDPSTPEEVYQIQSALSVPLISRGKVVGVISLDNTTNPQAFSISELGLLETLAPSIALTIDNSRLFAALNSRLEELAAINQLLTDTQEQTSPEQIVARFYETIAALLPIKAGLHLKAGFTGWKILQRLGQADGLQPPVTSPKDLLQADIQYLNLLPPWQYGLLLPAPPHQAILLASNRPLKEEQLILLNTLQEMLNNALQQIHLHERTKKQVALLSSMRDINTTLLGSLNFNLVFDLVLSHIRTYLQPAQVQIWRANHALQELEIAAWQGIGRPTRERLPYGQGLAGQIAIQRQASTPQTRPPLPDLDGVPANLTWHLGLPLIAKGRLKGVLTLHYASPHPLTFEQEDYLNTLAGQAALAIDNTEAWHESQRSTLELFQAYESILQAWGTLLEMRQIEASGHIERTTNLGLQLARRAGMRGSALLYFKWGAWLHDVGKLVLPEHLLHKKTPLTPEERAQIQKHPLYALQLLKPLQFLQEAIDIPYAHHERWDGQGYPRGLKGSLIPLAARVFAIVEAWDVLQTARPYGDPWPREKVIAHLQAERGKQFDPELTDLFLEMLAEEKESAP